jgi:dipeptidyl aminopeptidase/acylaminoacyl peptidase
MNPSQRTWLVLLLSLVCGPLALRAGEPARNHEVTIDDYFTLAYLSEVAIAPNGESVAYAEQRWQKATDDRKADLWAVDARARKPTRLTFDRGGYRSLKWSSDGKYLYFVGNRKRAGETTPPHDGSTQVWRLAVGGGGEPQAVTQVPGGIYRFDLTGDGQTLYYTTYRKEIEGDWASLRKQFSNLEYGHGRQNISEITRLDLGSWRTAKVAELRAAHSELAVAPDGRRLALVTAPEPTVVSFEGKSAVEVVDTATGAVKALPDELWRKKAPSPYGRLNSLAWAKDSSALAFVIAFDGYPSEVLVARWKDKKAVLAKLSRPKGVSLNASVDSSLAIVWRKGSSELCFLGDEKARVRLYCASGLDEGDTPNYASLTPGDVVIDSFSFDAAGGRAAVIMGGPKAFADVYLVEASGKARQLTDVNPQVSRWKLPRLSVVSWKGAKGAEVEGILELPAEAPAGKPLPMIVYLHGGPTSALHYQLLYTYFGHVLFSSKGYAVFSPNYRGSTGYGDEFLTELIGRENDIEVEDILKGVDALVRRKVADPNRLGVTGWSNGGYLTNCLISRTGRFKAASSGAGIADLVMEWGTNDEPAYSLVFVKGFPWNKEAEFRRVSPIFKFDKVGTPTIFHVGGNDERCPPGNSRMLYRALREYLKVETELVVYPGEGHGLGKYGSRKAKMAWDVAWFDRYVRGKGARNTEEKKAFRP